MQSAHEVPRQKLISSKEISKGYYDKVSETFENEIGQKALFIEETIRRGISKKLSPQHIAIYELLAVDGVNVTIGKGPTTQKVHGNGKRPFF